MFLLIKMVCEDCCAVKKPKAKRKPYSGPPKEVKFKGKDGKIKSFTVGKKTKKEEG